MGFVENFIKNPVKVTVFVILLVMFGLIAIYRMPIQLIPDVQIPTLTIETFWPGASPQEIENEIINEQEEQLKGVEGVTKMSSESMDSRGSIMLEFAVGTNLDAAITTVNARLQQVPEYPIDADKPVITSSNASNQAIAWFILNQRLPSADDFDTFAAKHSHLAESLERIKTTENPGLALFRLRELAEKHPEAKALLPPPVNLNHYRRFAEDVIEARFEKVPGVSQSNVFGGEEDELQVIVNPEQLAARRLTIADVRQALAEQNIDVSGGRLLGRKAAMGRPNDGPLPRSPAGCRHGDYAIGRLAGVCARCGRSEARFQEARGHGPPFRHIGDRDQRSASGGH